MRIRHFVNSLSAVALFCAAFSSSLAHPQAVTGSHPQSNNTTDRLKDGLWQFGGFFSEGLAPDYSVHPPLLSYSLRLDFMSAGIQAGHMMGFEHGSGLLRGRLELCAEATPFWRASYPRQMRYIHYTNPANGTLISPFGPYTRRGATITPLLLRWNFGLTNAERVIPWAQLGGGLLWTNHKFPLLGGSTSVINFTPQFGMGTNVFLREKQSLDLAVRAVHISNAGLGDNNPGVNATLQFSIGYSWWK